MIGSIHAKVVSGATSAKAALTTERSHLDLVTPNWLKECLLNQRQLKVAPFKPEVVKKTTATVLADLESKAKQNSKSGSNGLQYRVKMNIFDGQTFAVLSETFFRAGETLDFVESINRRILESGGRVVAQDQRANYVVQEDGFFAGIWQTED